MSPRFPQELFDRIIDYAEYKDEVLKSYSMVCKRWSVRSRSHFFKILQICQPIDLDRWCKRIPPTTDGPSKHVKDLWVQFGVVPLVHEPPPLDSYLNHFSALTRVVDLTLIDHRGKVHLDTMFQCFSGFRNSLRRVKLFSNTFGFEEVSRIIEFFPNLETLVVWSPNSPRFAEKAKGPFQPPRRASFPRLRNLCFHLFSKSPALEHNLLSGFAGASMDLETLSITGPVPDPSVVQKLLDSSAQSLIGLSTFPLGKSCSWRYPHTTMLMIHPPWPRVELDLSACDNLQQIEVHDLLHSYSSSCYFHDSLDKPRFEYMLRTITSPTLCAIFVRVTTRVMMGEDEYVVLPENDWRGVDTSLCDALVRVRAHTRNPLWTFGIRITGCVLYDDDNLPNLKMILPDFQGMGGIVLFSTSCD
ncbi:hypothetical protein BDM02DRAFT_2983653 [Thelephora ganbajun]|uniref:Uncharacterized protein n=1 Tax=Thelephora ganbajun TaxID=370292 RepID=A0ACB6ZAB6_THEGA|nr:hypothetical protein BDM02DRAFT_2983653 [Thelephora ganbajun]